jgi:hypothetical protein
MCLCKDKCAHSELTSIGRSCTKGVQFCSLSACNTCRLIMARCGVNEKKTLCTLFKPNSKAAKRLCQFCLNFKGGNCLLTNKVG